MHFDAAGENMVESFDIQEFLKKAKENPVLDVRSLAEHEYGKIPGAISFPLFSNEERGEIGILYKRQGREAAIKRGLEVVGPKMREMVEKAEALPYKDTVLVHCWRGGMRSGSVAWLLQTYGLPVATLKGGYKSFRNYVLSYFENPLQLLVIAGPTGSGKTDLLKALAKAGEQVIDLEGLAEHKGSVFGELGQNSQPSSEHFQNLIFWKLKDMDLSKPVWIEDESIGIGKVMIPEPFWNQMRRAPRIFFNMEREIRVKRLVKEYGTFSKDILQEKILQLQKKLGGQHVKSALEDLLMDRLNAVASCLLVYYDKAYANSIERYSGKILYKVEAAHEDYDKWALFIREKTKMEHDGTSKAHTI